MVEKLTARIIAREALVLLHQYQEGTKPLPEAVPEMIMSGVQEQNDHKDATQYYVKAWISPADLAGSMAHLSDTVLAPAVAVLARPLPPNGSYIEMHVPTDVESEVVEHYAGVCLRVATFEAPSRKGPAGAWSDNRRYFDTDRGAYVHGPVGLVLRIDAVVANG